MSLHGTLHGNLQSFSDADLKSYLARAYDLYQDLQAGHPAKAETWQVILQVSAELRRRRIPETLIWAQAA